MDIIQTLEAEQLANSPERRFRVGDNVKVHVRITEGDKERVQLFEGVVIDIHRASIRSSFTVRKISYGIGVERVFPLYGPTIDKVEFTRRGKVRRARLNYLKGLSGKDARIPERREIPESRKPISG